MIVYLLALLLTVGINLRPLPILGVIITIALGPALFSTLSLIIACIVKTRERFMGISQVLTMPIFFASNAIYPLSLMPPWLRAASHLNPLTYQVDILRALMLANGSSQYGLVTDFAILLATTAILIELPPKCIREWRFEVDCADYYKADNILYAVQHSASFHLTNSTQNSTKLKSVDFRYTFGPPSGLLGQS